MMEMAYFRSKSYFSSSLSRINNLLKHIRERVLSPPSFLLVSSRNEKSTANRILRNDVEPF